MVEAARTRTWAKPEHSQTKGPSWYRGRRLPQIILALAMVFGGVLRLEALTSAYDYVSSPSWLAALQTHAMVLGRALHPSQIRWDPEPLYAHRDGPPTHYRSDPYTYLAFGRSMRTFYAAHYREPVFPAVTRFFLHLLHDQDIAVSFASAAFSMLLIPATFWVGRLAFSSSVGLGAAWAVAIEYDVISWDIAGWRDGAFAVAVLICVAAMIRFRRASSRANAVVLGVAAAAACLIRLTSVTFLVPACAYVLLTSRRRDQVAKMGLAALVAAAIVSPYLVNCWRVFGDPFYSINYHTRNYVAMEGARPADASAPIGFEPPGLMSPSAATATAVSYVRTKLVARPYRMFDTVFRGLTVYPFDNKWTGLDRWWPGLGRALRWAALVGLVAFAASWCGRLLLLVLATSLLPFAVTWTLADDWRFTEHAYPFFLIAAAVAIRTAVVQLRISHLEKPERFWSRSLVKLWQWGVGAACVAVTVWFVTSMLPALTIGETLRFGEEATIMAGPRDRAFFASGWSAPIVSSNVTSRRPIAATAVLRLPLPRVEEYALTLRLDPFPRPLSALATDLGTIRLLLNDRPLSDISLRWNPQRVGSYDLRLPTDRVVRGMNRLAFVSTSPAAVPAVTVWYARIRPSTMPAASDPLMALDSPSPGASFTGGEEFTVSGWALDRASTRDGGIDDVRVYAFPFSNQPPDSGILLGSALLGVPRPDVASTFGGRRFDHAGFTLAVRGLPIGRYHLVAYARSTISATFNQYKMVDVTVAPRMPRIEMALDAPSAGAHSQPFLVGGWAVDLGSASGTGVNAVSITAVPQHGGPAIALGPVDYGGARPDVGKVFGARYTNSAFSLVVNGLEVGRSYRLEAAARSTVSGTFANPKTVLITITQRP
jgi:hypothetical protein